MTYSFSPPFLGAICWEETLKVMLPAEALGFISTDGGHGLFQLTSSYPAQWTQPDQAAAFAIEQFLLPALQFWGHDYHLAGADLIRAAAAEYNAGRQNAIQGHLAGDVGMYTTGGDYDVRVLSDYQDLVDGILPPGASNPN